MVLNNFCHVILIKTWILTVAWKSYNIVWFYQKSFNVVWFLKMNNFKFSTCHSSDLEEYQFISNSKSIQTTSLHTIVCVVWFSLYIACCITKMKNIAPPFPGMCKKQNCGVSKLRQLFDSLMIHVNVRE